MFATNTWNTNHSIPTHGILIQKVLDEVGSPHFQMISQTQINQVSIAKLLRFELIR